MKEVRVEELFEFIKESKEEFFICVELGEGGGPSEVSIGNGSSQTSEGHAFI